MGRAAVRRPHISRNLRRDPVSNQTRSMSRQNSLVQTRCANTVLACPRVVPPRRARQIHNSILASDTLFRTRFPNLDQSANCCRLPAAVSTRGREKTCLDLPKAPVAPSVTGLRFQLRRSPRVLQVSRELPLRGPLAPSHPTTGWAGNSGISHHPCRPSCSTCGYLRRKSREFVIELLCCSSDTRPEFQSA